MTETTIDLVVVYSLDDEEGETRSEQKLQVKLGKETTYYSYDGQTVILKYE